MTKPKEPTVAEILAAVKPRKPQSKLEVWLEANPKRAAKFWAVIEQGTSEGTGIGPLVEAWNSMYFGADRCPVLQNQVRERFNARRGERADGA